MAISFEEAEVRRQKHLEKEQRLLEESFNDDALKKLEMSIDVGISKHFYKKTKGVFFWKKTIASAKFSYPTKMGDARKTLINLIKSGKADTFLKRYRQKGWSVKYGLYKHGDNDPYVYFTKIIDPQIQKKDESDARLDINPNKTKLVEKKQKKLEELRIRAATIEAEIEMLTQSPNGRDAPLALTK